MLCTKGRFNVRNTNNNGNMQPVPADGYLDTNRSCAKLGIHKQVTLEDLMGTNMSLGVQKQTVTPAIAEKMLKRRMSFEAFSEQEQNIKFQSTALEGQSIERGSWAGHRIAVFTSGGDSQGMNASVRAIVRMGLYLGCRVFYIKEGYQGMVDGDDCIVEADWSSTSNIIDLGGTIIGSARCMDFKERAGRLKAANNLVERRITNLIAIGGDGSLTGANCFRQEWPSLLRELVDTGVLQSDRADLCGHLNIVGLVGSIDNDFCGTDMTIGVDSALHRIMQAVDDISTTAVSHKRAFVLEVMGRMCGYLPLMAGIASEATAIFIPENPPTPNWREELCEILHEKAKAGEVRRMHIVMVAEGAIDNQGNPIRAVDVQQVLNKEMKLDTRVTVLGHVQRGGNTSAFDRILGTRMGAEAVLALMDATPETPACVISLDGNEIVRVPLMKAVEKTKLVGERMAACDFDSVVKLRGRTMISNLHVFLAQQRVRPHPNLLGPRPSRICRLAMIHVGKPACGMNACCRGFVSVCLTYGVEPVFIHDSWEGLGQDLVKVPEWNSLHLWTQVGGSNLGIKPETAEQVGIRLIAMKLAKHRISGLIIVGGFAAFESAVQLVKARDKYEELCIPMNVVPACIDNNVPGHDHALGTDTAMNQIVITCDDLKKSAFSVQKCLYVVEVGGENCGYLTTLSGLAAGADAAYIVEEKFGVKEIKDLCDRMKRKLTSTQIKQGMVLRNENASVNLTTDFIYRILNEEGKPVFKARKSILGYIQEGNIASPHDRYTGIKAGCRSTAWMIKTMEANGMKESNKVFTNDPNTVTLASSKKSMISFVPVLDLVSLVDYEHCIPKRQWWMRLRPLMKILSFQSFTTYKANISDTSLNSDSSDTGTDRLVKFTESADLPSRH